MREGIDHIVILVRDLQNATRIYQDLGFQVTYGGEHPGISHNALIPFQDGSYLELFSFLRPEGFAGHRWSPLLETGAGLIDFAPQGSDMDDTVDRILAGSPMSGSTEAGAVRMASCLPGGPRSWTIG